MSYFAGAGCCAFVMLPQISAALSRASCEPNVKGPNDASVESMQVSNRSVTASCSACTRRISASSGVLGGIIEQPAAATRVIDKTKAFMGCHLRVKHDGTLPLERGPQGDRPQKSIIAGDRRRRSVMEVA